MTHYEYIEAQEPVAEPGVLIKKTFGFTVFAGQNSKFGCLGE